MQNKPDFATKLTRRLIALALMLVVTAAQSAGFGSGILKGFDGSFHTLEEYTGKGQWTVVMIWVSDCRACNAEAKQYVKFHKSHKGKDAHILGVSMDGM
jgi:hypothetical protein